MGHWLFNETQQEGRRAWRCVLSGEKCDCAEFVEPVRDPG